MNNDGIDYAAIYNGKVVNIIHFNEGEDTPELIARIIESSGSDTLVPSVPLLQIGALWDGTNFIYASE